MKPWLKEQMDEISDNIFNGEFFSICDQISDANKPISSSLPVFNHNIFIGAVLSANDIFSMLYN